MGIDFIERRRGGSVANGNVMASVSTRINNSDHQHHHHNHQQHQHINYSKVLMSEESPKENGHYNQSGTEVITQSANQNQARQSFSRSNVVSPISNGVNSPLSTPTTTSTSSKPSRTLSVRNFSNFVKRLPSLSLSPSVRIAASSLGFSSASSHNHNNATSASSSTSNGIIRNGASGNTATLKRPTTVSFQKKKARPFSYAEPGNLSSHSRQHNHTTNETVSGRSNFNPLPPVLNTSPKGRLENVGNGGATYNGHNVADLEARLARLRVQQLQRRKSLDFAISCVEPDPTCFSVEEQPLGQEVLGIYIKSVVKNGSADVDGRLAAGDQLLSVDGQSLIGISQEEAAKYLVRTGPVVTLEVAKQAALYHGLATMLNQPSPELSRGKGDGADLSFEDGDDELSGDDVELLEAGGGMNYMYNYNGYMRASCSSTTLLADNAMHLLSPPPPSEDIRKPTAFPHHLQLQLRTFHQRQQQNGIDYQNDGSSNSIVKPFGSGKGNMKLVRQLSFPQEEDEDEECDRNDSLHMSDGVTAPAENVVGAASKMSTSSSSVSSEMTPNANASSSSYNGCHVTQANNETACGQNNYDDDDDDDETGIGENDQDVVTANDNADEDGCEKALRNEIKSKVVSSSNRTTPASALQWRKQRAPSLPCSLQNGIALSPTASSCTNLIALSSSSKHHDNTVAMNGHGRKNRTTATMSTSMLLTSLSLNDISLTTANGGGGSSTLRDSNYWSSNCSTRESSTLCSPASSSSAAAAALLRSSQSDSSLARWNNSFEALSRKGLSESALGVPRIVGSSRLLKFLISTYNNSQDDEARNLGGGKSAASFMATRSKSTDAILLCGFNAPRRMSERDLPSKILREQNHDLAADHPIPGNQFSHGGHPLMMQGRIHSSKSVPSLNSDIPNVVGGGMQHSGNNSGAAPMVRSPAHHHHGNNVGGTHGQHMIQSQNHINESPNGPRYPHGYPTMSMTMQHGSKSSMMSGGHMNNMDAQTAAMRSRSIQSLADPPHRPDIGNKQPSTPALHMQQSEDTERFYQNVGFYPPPPPPPTNPANMPVRTYIPYSNSTGNISSQAAFRSPSGGGSHISPHYPGYPGVRAPPPNLNASVPSNLNWQQRMNATAHHPQQHQQNHGVSRDLLRQEAKMLEMQDELRRREERAALMMSKQQQQQQNNTQRYSQSQNQLGYPGGHPAQQRPVSGTGPPAPTPKPYREAEVAPGRPPLPEEFKHPAQFSASMTEIPKGAFSYNNGVVTKPTTLGGSAWAREEKENEAKRRKEAAKYWRDQQIHELEIVHHRSPVQDEQLRALKLEREFQRRAEEMQRNDEEGNDDEDDEEDDRKAMVRRLQEDLERTRISANGNSKLDPMEEERARKIEEMRRKKLELEAAHAAEERLVREAAKRREEELRRQHQMMQQQNQTLKHQQSQQLHHQQQQQQQQQQQHHQQPQPPQTLSYQSPYRSSYSKMGSPGSVTNENHLSPTSTSAPPLPKSPPPNTYKSAIQSSPQKSPVTPPQSSPKPKSDKKTVSFNETVATNEPPASPQEDEQEDGEKVREDPNKFLSEATALLASPRSPDVTIGTGSTPGVIGAQEVYRDPRMRRLAEKQQQQQAANTPKPEKLTFKEKMRMFAMESGDIESPKDKVKVSKAQREIENPIPGAPPPQAN